MYNRLILSVSLALLILTFFCWCSQTSTKPGNTIPNPHQFIRGRLLLENQSNHSHCPIVLDSVNIGTITDSTGYFEIFLPDSMSELNGTFQIYCYLYDYELDFFTVHIENGQLVWAEGDVLENGYLQSKTLKQQFSQFVSTEKSNYVINERIELSIELKNTSDTAIWISGSTIAMLGFYDVATEKTDWKLTQDPTGEMRIVEPDSSFHDAVNTLRTEKGNGYLIPFYSIRNSLPNSMALFLNKLECEDESVVYAGGPFFVFINEPKNLSFPLIQVNEN